MMPRENVFYKGKYAAFSTITDSFITQFRDKDSFELWRKIEYGINCVSIEESTIISIDDAIHSIHLNRNYDETLECLKDAGINPDEAKALVDKFEINHYRPIKDDNGKYRCPNCGGPVILGQEQCIDMTCMLKFVWRGIIR